MSILRAVISAPGIGAVVVEYEASGVVKLLERCVRIGVNLSSSSRRGRARDVNYHSSVIVQPQLTSIKMQENPPREPYPTLP